MITHGLAPFFLCFSQVHSWQTGAGRVQCLSWHQSPAGRVGGGGRVGGRRKGRGGGGGKEGEGRGRGRRGGGRGGGGGGKGG